MRLTTSTRIRLGYWLCFHSKMWWLVVCILGPCSITLWLLYLQGDAFPQFWIYASISSAMVFGFIFQPVLRLTTNRAPDLTFEVVENKVITVADNVTTVVPIENLKRIGSVSDFTAYKVDGAVAFFPNDISSEIDQIQLMSAANASMK